MSARVRAAGDISSANLPYITRPINEAQLALAEGPEDPGPALKTNDVSSRPDTGQRPLPPIPRRHVSCFVDTTNRHASNGRPRDNENSMAVNNSNAFPALDTSFSNRVASPAAGTPAGSQTNGAGMNNMPNYVTAIPGGHQQDLNYLFAQIQDLSSVLAANRDKVNDITRSAEEVARRANNAAPANGQDGDWDHDSDKAKIRELEHQLASANKVIDIYKHEQRENTSLIAQYEDALGTATEQIRSYCNDIDSRFLGQRRYYNNLLQAEKDEHFKSRLDRDHWHDTSLQLCEMIRTASRLRNEEWYDEYRVVVGLQTEVRCFRRVLGLEAQKPEEETGWPYLQDVPHPD